MLEPVPTASYERMRYGRYLSGTKFFRALRRFPGVLANLRWQCGFIWFLLRSRATRALLVRQPVLPFKYLSRDYLAAKKITSTARASALAHNYKFLHRQYKPDFLTQVFETGIVLTTIEVGSQRYSVDLRASGPCFEEGELSLFFRTADVAIYCVSFSFIPGEVLGFEVPTLLLVTRIQGKAGCYPQIREAMKTLGDLSLPKVLFSLLEGIAKASDVHDFAGISAADLPGLDDGQWANHLHKTYDGFFHELGAASGITGFYHSSLPFSEKPLSEVDSNHRSRVKSQRKLKAEMRAGAHRHLLEHRQKAEVLSRNPQNEFIS